VADFSASEAAFTGFRVVAHRPWLVLVWALLQFAFALAITSFVTLTAGPAYERLNEIAASGQAPPVDEMSQLMQQLAPTSLAVVAAGLVYYAIFYAAMSRAVLRPDESRFGYLRLGADELRQLGLLALLLLVAFAIYVAAFVVGVLIGGVFALVASPEGAPALSILMAILVGGPLLLVAAVRLSLSPAITFASARTVSLADSWRLTRGRFWPMIGTYLVATALNLVVLVCTFTIALAASALVGGFGALGDAVRPSSGTLADAVKPASLVYLVVLSIGEALRAPVLMTPPTYIYAALTGRHPAAQGWRA
jgi:hypothetical protein